MAQDTVGRSKFTMVRVNGAYVCIEQSFVEVIECAIKCGENYIVDVWNPENGGAQPADIRVGAKNILRAYLEQF